MKPCKIWCLILLCIVLSVIVIISTEEDSYSEFSCTECHSKRPGTLAMHKALVGEDCFDCHVRGEKLRQKGGIPEEKHQAFLKQRLKDPKCTRCHVMGKPDLSMKKSEHPATLSGSTYCPKCQIIGDGDWKMCPKCGGNLLNLDKLMFESAQNPDQVLCRECHLMESSLEKKHLENIGSEFSSKSDCLNCHQGHNECAGCHQ